MLVFARWVEHAFDVTVQCTHHAYAREHRWSVMLCNQQKSLHRGLPFFGIGFCFEKFGDVLRRVAERDQRFSARQCDRIEKPLIP
jgi:hypothetical protein